ncbi:hypothetical protein AGMMS49975_12360 [Clostridia bacterium]|nr:hypothetical protein AGMMS49975_12360 [Clostridia bacterium]
MKYYSVKDLVKIETIKNTIKSIGGWDNINLLIDVVVACDEFIEAFVADFDAEKLATGESEHKANHYYKKLKDLGAI